MSNTSTTTEIVDLPVADIAPSGVNDRKTFDPDRIEQLARSIRRVGQLMPILVAPDPDPYARAPWQIVAGERRWRAALVNQSDTIQAIVRPAADPLAMLAENTGRVDLNPIEEAAAYKARMEDGVHIRTVAETAGVSVRHIESRLGFLRLCPEARHLLVTGQITAKWAGLLKGLDSNRQVMAIRAWSDRDLSWNEAQRLCERLRADQGREGLFDESQFELVLQEAEAIRSTNERLHPKRLAGLADEVLAAYGAVVPDDLLDEATRKKLAQLRAAIDYRLKRTPQQPVPTT